MRKHKFLYLMYIIMIFSIAANQIVAASPSEEHTWFCKRCADKQPPILPQESLLTRYGGYCIDRRVDDNSADKVLYLTFDAGYENGNVERILDTLKSENVPAAFFVLDNIILKNTDLVTRMADEGHLVCNHTKNHKNICNMAVDEIENDLSALEKIYYEKTGREMAKYFRFPEGKYSESALAAVKELGYTTVFWSFAYADWDNNAQPSADRAMKKILDNTHNGAIMLFHPTSSTNAEIFPALIKEWKARGYTFGTLDGLK